MESPATARYGFPLPKNSLSYRSLSDSQRADEMPSRFGCSVSVEIVVAAFWKPHESLGIMRQRKQLFPEADGNGGVLAAMHDEKRRGHAADPSVRMETIAHQPAHRQ